MKVRDLIEVLESLPADALVVLSSDPEGNSHSPAAEVAPGIYVPDEQLADIGDVLTPEDARDRLVHGDRREPCVCLWPTR